MGRGGQRPKDTQTCPECDQQVAVHTWSGKLFDHICLKPEEMRAYKAQQRAERLARSGGRCPDCKHFMDRHASEKAGFVGRNWMGCNAKRGKGRFQPTCDCKRLRKTEDGERDE